MEGRASAFFEQLARTAYNPRLRGVQGTYRFDLENLGSWRVTVRDGTVQAEQGQGDADCVIACEAEDFLRIVEGKQNLLTAGLQGRVRVRGDVAMAKVLHGLQPGPG